ncbi:MAG: PAS domain S-box protein [Acidimicrobiales bacterium]
MDDPTATTADLNRLAAAYLEAAPDAVIAVDGYGIITLVNHQAEMLFGYAAGELVGESVELIVPTSLRRAHVEHRKRYAADAKVRIMGAHTGRLHGRCKDGTLVPVDVALSPIELDGHTGAIAIGRDVRTHIKAEAEYEIVQRTLDAVEDAVFMMNPESLEFVYVNEGAQSQIGFDRFVLTSGMRLDQIMPEFNEQQVRELLRPLLRGDDSSVALTTVHRHRAGHDVPVDILLHYPRISGDAPRRIVSIVRDITERQAAEDRLRASEAEFRSAFIDAPVAMVLTAEGADGSSEIVEANHAFRSMLGLGDDDLTGRHLSDLVAADDEPPLRNADGSTERRYLHKDGHQIWGAVHLSELTHPEAERRRLSHIVDISRRVAAERQRDRREQLFSSLAEIRQATLLEQPVDSVLELTLHATSRLLDAPHTFVAVPSVEGSLVYRAVVSTHATDLAGRALPPSPTIRQVVDTGRPGALLAIADLDDHAAHVRARLHRSSAWIRCPGWRSCRSSPRWRSPFQRRRDSRRPDPGHRDCGHP